MLMKLTTGLYFTNQFCTEKINHFPNANKYVKRSSFLKPLPSKLQAYDIPVLSRYLDYVSVMTYDYHGQWDKVTGHLAPLKEHPDDADKTFNLVRNI